MAKGVKVVRPVIGCPEGKMSPKFLEDLAKLNPGEHPIRGMLRMGYSVTFHPLEELDKFKSKRFPKPRVKPPAPRKGKKGGKRKS